MTACRCGHPHQPGQTWCAMCDRPLNVPPAASAGPRGAAPHAAGGTQASHGPAIAAITRILTDADGTPRADPEYLARAIIATLTGHGWRLTNAQPAPPSGPPAPPTAEFRAARAAIQEVTHDGA